MILLIKGCKCERISGCCFYRTARNPSAFAGYQISVAKRFLMVLCKVVVVVVLCMVVVVLCKVVVVVVVVEELRKLHPCGNLSDDLWI